MIKHKYGNAMAAARMAHEHDVAIELEGEAQQALESAISAGEYRAASEIAEDLGQKICLICLAEPYDKQFKLMIPDPQDSTYSLGALYTCERCWNNRVWQDTKLMRRLQGLG